MLSAAQNLGSERLNSGSWRKWLGLRALSAYFPTIFGGGSKAPTRRIKRMTERASLLLVLMIHEQRFDLADQVPCPNRLDQQRLRTLILPIGIGRRIGG